MSEKPLDQRNLPEQPETEIVVNEYGETRDPAVVVDQPDRTVLLTKDETIVVEKEPRIDVVPVNRPRKVYGGMWGQPELITVGLSMLAVLTVVLLYIFVVVPAQSELDYNRAERERLNRELISAQSKYGEITDTRGHVEKLMTSVDDFESRYLPVSANGRTALYQRINGLISAYGLVNTTGPDYAPLEVLTQNEGVETDEEKGRAKYRSLFPGVYVTMTVEGSYQSLRRFVREIESGGDFVVISTVELEPSDSDGERRQNQNPQAQTQAPQMIDPTRGNPAMGNPNFGGMDQSGQAPARRGKTHGEVVSLRLEMAAYFRRPNVAPAIPAPTEQ